MKRKTLILLTMFFLISISTVCFADMANDIKSTLNGATNTVVDGTQNLAEDVRSGIGSAENTIEDGVKNIGNAVMNTTNDVMDDNNNNDDYVTTRTAAEDVSIINNTAASTWTWIAVAIAGIVIVGLVWYYASERNHKH